MVVKKMKKKHGGRMRGQCWKFLEKEREDLAFKKMVPAWSCSWDLNNSHYIYAGLQNGSVLVFDMRKTAGPMKSLVGFTSNPVHTVHALAQTSSLSSGVKTILSASVVGLCQWNIDSEER
ncbi:E3 ubiquitin-protein ligase RFWD3 [Glycine soja]|uniref:RING-type E3 ubiquitin transferase n=1 Tax=Glycine soja TaxID=3848 RepID=A0A0B2PXU3_GLYSO|nr:E3 ubiquitin-protein ligase RFWD3 [Glycine soja]